jgi:hypothetical protein
LDKFWRNYRERGGKMELQLVDVDGMGVDLVK